MLTDFTASELVMNVDLRVLPENFIMLPASAVLIYVYRPDG